MTALDLLREKKRKQLPLTALEQVILDAFYSAEAGRPELTERAIQAANELAHMQERIEDLNAFIAAKELAIEERENRIFELGEYVEKLKGTS